MTNIRGAGIKTGTKCISKTRSPSFCYIVRQLTYGNTTGESYGITVPKTIASKFLNTKLNLIITGSGFSYYKKEVNI